MAKAIYQTDSGFTAGTVALGIWGHETGSIKQEVIDGDTVNVQAPSNFGIRFLGIDAPEKNAQLKDPDSGELEFKNLANIEWKTFLSDPFAELASFEGDEYQGLVNYLQNKGGPDAAENQYQHGKAAEDALEKEISDDIKELDKCIHSFRFFLAFSHEIMDRYGRFLCFINRYQKKKENRPDTQ